MSVNKVILIGNVGKDPEVRYLEGGVAVASFPLATTERGYKTATGAQIPDRTEWHNIVVWRGLAEVVEKYVRKGSPLYIEGKIRSRSWDDQNGAKRYITEIYADSMELLGRRPENGAAGTFAPGAQPMAQPAQQPMQQPAQQVNTQYQQAPQYQPQPAQQMPQEPINNTADDLPF